ncbi:FAD-binding oxidoreductase [Trinickia sp. YCB016]
MRTHSSIRRRLLKIAAVLPLVSGIGLSHRAFALLASDTSTSTGPKSRVRPGAPDWPSEASWNRLRQQVGDALIEVQSPLATCAKAPDSLISRQLFSAFQNPYFLRDQAGLTQSFGWVDAWATQPSVYAVAARNASDVAAAVNFARENRLRLVVKGGGHSYQGTSNAPDSLLIWTRKMTGITIHDAFVGAGCEGQAKPVRAVSIGAGAVWAHVYDAVTTRVGGYVQGGGCLTVGVAGLVQSGGFGSFSKAFGTAAGSLIEAEVVTADGVVRIANACTNSELFWGLKGGGGGSLGVVTRLTLRVHDLPETFGAVNLTIKAASPEAFRRLIGLMLDFYSKNLLNPHWGEQIHLRRDNVLEVRMLFQGLDRAQAKTIWQPFLDAVDRTPDDFKVDSSPFSFVAISARTFWAPTLVKRLFGVIRVDDRPGAPNDNVYWSDNRTEAAACWHGYQSAWLPADLLHGERRPSLADALYAASRHWRLALHFNKGLAGGSEEAIAAAKDTVMNPAVLDAFALVICAAQEPRAYPGIDGHEPNVTLARDQARAIGLAMDELRKLVPDAGSYVSESDFFLPGWQRAYWGANYARLQAVKAQYDPEGLFFVHQGVGSERWSADGFIRLD